MKIPYTSSCVKTLGAAFLVAGCAAPEPSATKSSAILGGVPSANESVVVIRSSAGADPSFCTATMIAKNVLLTARHCVSEFQEGDFICTIDGNIDSGFPRVPATAGELGLPDAPSTITVHLGLEPDLNRIAARGKRIFAPETDTICRNDLAVVELDTSLDVSISPLRLDSGVERGEALHLVGFGTNDTASVSRVENDDLTVLAVGPSDFFAVEGDAMPRTFVVGRAPCPGDSGGPAFARETGAVLGVFSLSRGGCASSEARNFCTQLAPYRSFLRTTFDTIGVVPQLEASPEGRNEGGAAGASGDGTEHVIEGAGCQASHRRGAAVFPAPIGLLLIAALIFRRRFEGKARPQEPAPQLHSI